MSANPTARHYHSVALRRVAAAESSGASLHGLRRMVLERVEEEEKTRFRPLEDPYLVGEVAARRAREDRLARENGDEILVREDKRWDWWLGRFQPSSPPMTTHNPRTPQPSILSPSRGCQSTPHGGPFTGNHRHIFGGFSSFTFICFSAVDCPLTVCPVFPHHLAQMKDLDEREKSWTRFRRGVESGPRGKLARRIGARLGAF